MSDLRNVLTGLNALTETETETLTKTLLSTKTETLVETGTKIVEENFQCGEHLAAVSYDDNDNCLQWYLGVVDHIEENNILVSYMKRSDKKGEKWLFLDESDDQKTDPAQVLQVE